MPQILIACCNAWTDRGVRGRLAHRQRVQGASPALLAPAPPTHSPRHRRPPLFPAPPLPRKMDSSVAAPQPTKREAGNCSPFPRPPHTRHRSDGTAPRGRSPGILPSGAPSLARNGGVARGGWGGSCAAVRLRSRFSSPFYPTSPFLRRQFFLGIRSGGVSSLPSLQPPLSLACVCKRVRARMNTHVPLHRPLLPDRYRWRRGVVSLFLSLC